MFAGSPKVYFKWIFALLCLYVLSTMLFWDYDGGNYVATRASVDDNTLLGIIGQSHHAWNTYARRTQTALPKTISTKSFRHEANVKFDRTFIVGNVYNFNWTSVNAAGYGHLSSISAVAELPANDTAVIVYDCCDDNGYLLSPSITFYNIYAYYDSVVHCAERIRSVHSHSVLVWASPMDSLLDTSHMASSADRADLRKLHLHLVSEHLIKRRGILVLPPPPVNLTTSYAALAWLEILRNQLQFIQAKISEKLLHDEEGRRNHDQVALRLLAQHQQTSSEASLRQVGSLHAACAKYAVTRRYHAPCHPPGSLAYPLLITGLGGAGTHFVAQRLRSVGWRVLHEDIDVDGSVSWFYGTNDRAVGLRYPYGALTGRKGSYLYPRFGHVVHLVRSPAEQISSFTAHSNKTYNFVLRTMQLLHNVSSLSTIGGVAAPVASGFAVNASVVQAFQQARLAQHSCLRGGSCHLHFAALSWLHWNRFVHSFADATYRVDQSEEVVRHLCSLELNRTAQAVNTGRWCKVEGCPASEQFSGAEGTTFLQDVQQRAFHVLDQVFGVCKINDALFQRSGAHKRHLRYNLSDIARIDAALADDIRRDALKYGFDVS